MKPIFRTMLGAIAIFIVSRAPAAESPVVQSAAIEVVEGERQIGQAAAAHDRSVLAKLISPDFVCLSPSGRVIRKAEIVDLWSAENAGAAEGKFEIENPLVFADGGTAICIATTIDSWTEQGVLHSRRERVFDVWRKTTDGWRLVASTSTPIDSSR
jgi:ketosteroid isomerase-like protein